MNRNVIYAQQSKLPLNVVVIGGSRGLGKSLVKNFVKNGDKVFSISRKSCDIGKPKEFLRSINESLNTYFDGEPIHIWINNAAVSKGYTRFTDYNVEDIEDIVSTNLTGTILGTRFAMDKMATQKDRGIIYNVTGAGSNMGKTPFYSVYGATKCAVPQFTKSIAKEKSHKHVGFALISPGMLKTELLLQNIPDNIKAIINKIAEDPEYVGEKLVPMIKSHYDTFNIEGYVDTIRFFDIFRIIARLLGVEEL